MDSVLPSIMHEDFMRSLESITPTPETIILFRIILKRTLKGVLREAIRRGKGKTSRIIGCR